MYKSSLGSVTAEVEALLAEKLSARGRNLEEKLKSAGRAVPKAVREQAIYLIEAESRYRNPKRAHQYDPQRVEEAHRICIDFLQKIDRSQIRARRSLTIFTTILVNLFLAAILFWVIAAYIV